EAADDQGGAREDRDGEGGAGARGTTAAGTAVFWWRRRRGPGCDGSGYPGVVVGVDVAAEADGVWWAAGAGDCGV
ncbi:hypothetical protein LTR57_008345, partial [Friedmanniomyces endolithicus]